MKKTLERGSSLSRYTIVSVLGAGGMGEVYEARDERLERAVAIKVLPPELVRNDDRVRRFVQEAKSASGLNHPHIVAIYDIGQAEDDGGGPVHYIAMELVRGQTLTAKIHRDRAELRELLRWLAQVADGISKAHTAGIIHRDLKPDNIMVSSDGFAKILDFGLAKLVERTGDIASGSATAIRTNTKEGAIVGTIGYMSPEQVQGKLVDHRSDIFSFGCILYEAATRRKPFDADSDVEIMHRILRDTPAPVHEANPDVPTELRRVIRRCLAKDPDKRYQSMKDLAIELGDMVEEFDQLVTEASSRSSASGERIVAPPSRNRLLAIVVTMLALAAIAVALTVRFAGPAADDDATGALEATFSQLTDLGGAEDDVTISPDGRTIAYVKSVDGNHDIFVQRVGGSNPVNLTKGTAEQDRQPAFSPDGEWIAFRSGRSGGGIFVMGATGESVRRLTDFGFHPAWSPDGKQLVVATEGPVSPYARQADSALWIVEVDSGTRREIYKGDAVGPQWSPNGHRIAFWALTEDSGQRDIFTIPAGGGDPVPVTGDPALDFEPVWSPDGTHLYFASDRGGTVNLWRIAIDETSGKILGPPRPVTTPSRMVSSLAIAADGKTIAFTSLESERNIDRLTFDPKRLEVVGEPLAVTKGSALWFEADLSPDGAWLVARTQMPHEDLQLMRSDGTEQRKLTDDAAKDRGPAFSPDGSEIAFYSDRGGRYELWSIRPDGSGLRKLTETRGSSFLFPSWSPDGRRIAGSTENARVIFDVLSAAPQKTMTQIPPAPDDERMFAEWSPDGRWLAGLALKPGNERVSGVLLYSIETKRYEKLAPELPAAGPPRRLVWLRDSRSLLVVARGGLQLIDLETKRAREIYRFPEGFFPVSLTTDAENRHLYVIRVRDESDVWLATVGSDAR